MGAQHLENKLTEIENYPVETKPYILGVSKVNLRWDVDILEVKIEGHTLLTLQALENLDIACSRLVVYVREDVVFTQLQDFENDIERLIGI